MRKEREALLVATLAGLVIVGAAALVVQPSLGARAPQVRVQTGQVAAPAYPVSTAGPVA